MLYLFEDYALDTDRRELRRGADVIGVAPQVFDLLVFLISNRDRFVGRAGEAQSVLRTLQMNSPSSFEMYVRRRPPAYCSVEYGPMLDGLRKAGWKD